MEVPVVHFCLISVIIAAAHLAGGPVEALSYDYSATIECLTEPHEPQYGGGIVINPKLDDGLRGWSVFAGGRIERRETEGGNNFIVSHNRSRSYHGPSQKLYLQSTKLYTLSAWVQVSGRRAAPVTAVFKTISGFTHAGRVVARSGCWSMLKGGLTVNASGPSELYFETDVDTDVEIWVDSVSLQPFTPEEWASHQEQSREKVRKKTVRFQVVNSRGVPVPNATVTVQQKNSGFPLGCAMSKEILTNTAYQNWFTSRFTFTTFENEMKWYSTERVQGQEDYSAPDAMMAFAKQHGISVRGHNVFWEDPHYQQWWVASLSPDQLRAATERRIVSVMSRYKGQVTGWDVVNENLHFSFFESKLGSDASSQFYKRAHEIDPGTPLFMNDYNTLEEPADPLTTPGDYLAKLREMAAASGGAQMGIGLEGHFHTPNIPYMRSALDTLAATGTPIWITELDVASNPNQAMFLEQIMNEAHSHPGVHGIIVWGAWHPQGCYAMCLTDGNFNNLPTGNVVDRLRGQWSSLASPHSSVTDEAGFFQAHLFHGDYELTITNPVTNNSSVRSLSVTSVAGEVDEGSHYFEV